MLRDTDGMRQINYKLLFVFDELKIMKLTILIFRENVTKMLRDMDGIIQKE